MRKQKKIVSGLMATLTMLSTIISPMTCFAAETPKEVIIPYYEEVKDQLDADEVVIAHPHEVLVGSDYHVEIDLTGIEIPNAEKTRVKFHQAMNEEGEHFTTNHADVYDAVYYVEPVNKEHPKYQIHRKLTVKEPIKKESSSKKAIDVGKDEKQQESTDDGEAESKIKKIIGFTALERTVYEYTEKPSLLQMESIFPDEIEGILEDGTKIWIPVSWKTEKNYDATYDSSYEFHVNFDTTSFNMSKGVKFPTVTIKIHLSEDDQVDRILDTNSKAVPTYMVVKKELHYYIDNLKVGKYTLLDGNNQVNAFCVQHQLNGPDQGDTMRLKKVYTKQTDATSNVSKLLRKVLYYGWHGPGDIGIGPNTSGNKGPDKGKVSEASHFRRTALAASVANNNEDSYYKYGQKFIDYLKRYPDAPEDFDVYVVDAPKSNQQDLAFYRYNPKAKAQVLKESTNVQITNNNPCYSLSGAEYKIYSDKNASSPLATLTTATNGYSNIVELKPGNYYIRETKAPKGYVLDSKIYPFAVSTGKTNIFKHKDFPQLAPIGLLLEKVDQETNQNRPQGFASLQDAQFTVKYYAGLWDKDVDPARLGQIPIRTWVFRTDSNGHTYFDDRFKVSGDALYYSSTGKAGVPIGTITIQETKAPEGYHINQDIYVQQIKNVGTEEEIYTYNYPVITEKILQLELLKKQEGTNTVLPNAVFKHTLPNGTIENVTTDSTGKLTIKGLTRGRHKLQEITAPVGYLVNGNILEFDVSGDNKVSLVSTIDPSKGNVQFEVSNEGNIFVVMEDKLAFYTLKVQKFNDKNRLLKGAEFTLYSERECKNIIQSAMTDDTGILTMKKLVVGTRYYLKETKAPEGYRLPTDLFGNPIVYEIYADTNPVTGEFLFYVDGKSYTSESDPNGMFTVTGTRDDRIVNMKIINKIGKLLPETGSSGMILLIILGSMFVGISYYIKTKKQKGIQNMGNMKKVFSILFASALIMSSATTSLTANAAALNTPGGVADFGKGTASITINGNKDQTLVGKKFNVYELFHAQNSVGGESINYTFNETFKLPLQTVVGKKLNKPANTVTEYEVIDYIQTLNTNPVEGAHADQKLEGSYSQFRYFVEELRNEIVKQGVSGDVVTVTATAGNNSIQIDGLDYGYYIVDEVGTVEGSHSAASLCIVNTANPDADVVVKSDYPSLVKKIQEDDDKVTIGNDGWNDMADFEIGQTVPYRYTSNIPNMNGYHTYYYAWHDKMDPALTFDPTSVSVVIKDNEKSYKLKPSEFKVIENPGNGETFKIEVADIKAIVDREFNQVNHLKENVYGQEVTVRYDAVLNDLAAKDTGMPGFENDVKLEFSNDPDSTGAGSTGETPWDTVVCFTYRLNVLKTNNHNLHLEGAKFRLYSDETCTEEVFVKKEADGYHVINRDSTGGKDHTGGEVPSNAVEMVSDKNGDVVILGLDGNTYWLKETEAPAGYRKILDPIRIEVKPTFAVDRNSYVKGDGANGKALVNLEAYAYIKQFLSGVFKDENLTLTTDSANGSANINVINTVGKKLPITGSNGMILLLGAGCILVVLGKKCKEKEENQSKQV